MAARIDRFKDQEGTLHITNAGEGDPAKPGAAPSPNPPPGGGGAAADLSPSEANRAAHQPGVAARVATGHDAAAAAGPGSGPAGHRSRTAIPRAD